MDDCLIRNVWFAAALLAKCDAVWFARLYLAFVGVAISWLEWNALRSRFFYTLLFEAFSVAVFVAPGSTVVLSHVSPANLAGI